MVRILLLAALFIPSVASADLIDGVNDIRHRGCGGARGVPTTLKRASGLNDVAREWSRGGRLREALPRTDYRAVNSASMRVEGTTDDRAILNVLRNTYCETILDPSITEIGMYRRDRNVWIVVAAPFSPPTPRDATTVARTVLELVNRARARDRKCGTTPYPQFHRSRPRRFWIARHLYMHRTWLRIACSSIVAPTAARRLSVRPAPVTCGAPWEKTSLQAPRMPSPSPLVGSTVRGTARTS